MENEFVLFLEDVPLAACSWVTLQHGGAPPHFWRSMEFLKGDYEGRWIRTGQVVCPIQSSDLNTLHFFLWGCI